MPNPTCVAKDDGNLPLEADHGGLTWEKRIHLWIFFRAFRFRWYSAPKCLWL